MNSLFLNLLLAFEVNHSEEKKNKEIHKCFDLKWQTDCPVKVKPLCVFSASLERNN